MKTTQARVLVLFSVVSIAAALAATEQRSGRRIDTKDPAFKSPCGTADQVSRKAGECLDPIFNLIAGNYPSPSSDADIQNSCNLFYNSSRCMRHVAKECLTGLHKASVGAVASAARRFYSSECKSAEARAIYLEPLKCSLKNGAEMKKLYEIQTGIMQGVRDLPITPEEKLVKLCCVLNDIDTETARIFDKSCPESTSTVFRLIHAIADDARNTLCRNPRCKGVLDMVKNHKYTPQQNFIEPVLQIMLSMNVGTKESEGD